MYVLAPICTILALAMSNLVLGSSTLVELIHLFGSMYSFWRRILRYGGAHLFGEKLSILVIH